MKFVKLQEYGEYAVILRQDEKGNPIVINPYVVAFKANEENGEVIDWAYGHYFDDLFNAVNFAYSKGKEVPNYHRLNEIVGIVLHLFVADYDDEDESESVINYCVLADNLDLDVNEAEYFGLKTKYFE